MSNESDDVLFVLDDSEMLEFMEEFIRVNDELDRELEEFVLGLRVD